MSTDEEHSNQEQSEKHAGGRPTLYKPEYCIEIVESGCKPKSGMCAIYLLFDSETRKPIYVGKAKNPWKRLQSHLSAVGSEKTKVSRWIASRRRNGFVPFMVVVEWTHEWEKSERRWIAEIRSQIPDLLNVADGGNHFLTEKRRDHVKGPISPFRELSIVVGKLIANAEREGRIEQANKMRDRMKSIRANRRRLLSQDTEILSLYDKEIRDSIIGGFEKNQMRNQNGARR